MLVEYLDHMGDDLAVVNAARVSFDKQSDWEYDMKDVWLEYEDDCGNGWDEKAGWQEKDLSTKRLKKADEKLIHYLAKHNHFTPFTHAVVKFRWTVPIFMARQLFKHQIGLSINEISRRYVDSDPEFFMPQHWRARHESAKQGSKVDEFVEFLEWPTPKDRELNPDITQAPMETHSTQAIVEAAYISAFETYKLLLGNNVCPEQARMVLPQSMYTSYIWTGSLAAWARIYNLRNKPTAQLEHKVLMDQLSNKMEELFPVSWKALTTQQA